MTSKLSFLKGTQATAEAFNTAFGVLASSGMSTPATFSVVNNTLHVGPHSGVFGCGAVITETETQEINTQLYFSIGASAFKGTVLYRLDPSLYFSPVISIETGHLSVSADPYVLVVGWLSYPGGSNNNISDDMFYPARSANDFAYTTYLNAKELLSCCPVVLSNPNGLGVVDTWYAAQHPEQYVLNLGIAGASSLVEVYAQDVNSEYWLVFENKGISEQVFDYEVLAYSNAEACTSAHLRAVIETGVVISTGIMYRGRSERTLSSGTMTGPVDAGTISLSLIETNLPVRETFRLRFHVRLPGGKKLKLASLGTGNASFFDQTYTAD
jgi:hypothetical protein